LELAHAMPLQPLLVDGVGKSADLRVADRAHDG
jgi:hypothetical protein